MPSIFTMFQTRWVYVQVIKRADIFQPQNVSNTLWAFASTGFEPSDIFLEMVENHLTENISPNATAPYSAQVRLDVACQCILAVQPVARD